MGVKERRARKHAAVEQLILKAAAELLQVSGSVAVSLRAVAERIEYSPAAIYGYFSSKQDLLAALAAQGFRRLNHALTRPSTLSHVSPPLRLREFYWRYYEFSKSDAASYELMFLDPSYEPGRWEREALACLGEAMAEADRLIADCVASGEFVSDMPPRALRLTLWSALHGAAVIRLRKRLPADVDPDRFAADTLDAALAGCLRRCELARTGGVSKDL